MGPVLVRLGAEFRSRWRSWLNMALLLGVVGGAVLAVAAGARRTDTAYPRFLEAVRAYDVGVFQFTSQEGFATIDFDQVSGLPQVAEAVSIRFYGSGEIGLMIALGVVAVIVLANVVAMGPARVAARTQPAEILRTE